MERCLDALRTFADFGRYLVQRFVEDGCQRRAAALTYMSLFAIVPLMTVTYALFSAIPAFGSVGDQINNLIFEYFAPTAGNQVQEYLLQFSSQARKLTVWGFVVLGLTAFFMLKNIEKAFNHIWHTRGNRQGLSGFLLYWAVLSLGPILLGIGFLASTYLMSLSFLFGETDALGLSALLLPLLPWLTVATTFTLLFYAVPNCAVPFSHALAGGLLTSLLFEGAKKAFTLLVSNTSYELVYGTFAAVPLFLLWIYFSWLLLLAGAEFVRALSVYGDSRYDQPDILVALAMLALFHHEHHVGRPISERRLLRERWRPGGRPVTRERWENVRNALLSAGLLQATDQGDYVLGRDLRDVTLWQLARHFAAMPGLPDTGLDDQDWFVRSVERLNATYRDARTRLGVSLDELLQPA